MKGLFVNPNDQITIKVVVGTDKEGDIIAAENLKELKEFDDSVTEENTETLEIIFRRPTFKDTLEATNNMLRTDGIDYSLNTASTRLNLMSSLIKAWNLTDAEGNPVDPNRENIEQLAPVVAIVIAGQLESSIGSIL